MQAPQNTTKPFCVYQLISPNREYSHSGYSGLSKPRVQISCYAETYDGAHAVADKVIEAVEAWPGATNIQAAFIDNQQDMYDSETDLYHVPVDFIVHYGG